MHLDQSCDRSGSLVNKRCRDTGDKDGPKMGSTPTPSEKEGCASVEKFAFHGDVHHGSNSTFAESALSVSLHFLLAPRTLWRPCTVARPPVASLRLVLIAVRFVAALSRSLRLQYVKKSVNNPSTFAGECAPALPPYLVSQVRSGVHCRICSWVRCRVHLGGRTRLRSRVCSRVVGENINASAQQRI